MAIKISVHFESNQLSTQTSNRLSNNFFLLFQVFFHSRRESRPHRKKNCEFVWTLFFDSIIQNSDEISKTKEERISNSFFVCPRYCRRELVNFARDELGKLRQKEEKTFQLHIENAKTFPLVVLFRLFVNKLFNRKKNKKKQKKDTFHIVELFALCGRLTCIEINCKLLQLVAFHNAINQLTTHGTSSLNLDHQRWMQFNILRHDIRIPVLSHVREGWHVFVLCLNCKCENEWENTLYIIHVEWRKNVHKPCERGNMKERWKSWKCMT